MNRIDGLNPLNTGRTAGGQASQGVEAVGHEAEAAAHAAARHDNVSLSHRGRVVAIAANEVHRSPEVRADRVAVLKARIEGGTYTSDARDIARRLLPTLLQD